MEDNNKEISVTTPEGETIKGVIDWNKFHKEKEFIEKLEGKFDPMQNSTNTESIDKYSDFSYEKISRVIKDVMLEDRQKKQRNIIIWTGYKGMKTFNFYLVYRLSPNKINMKIIKWRVKNKNNKLTVENYKERHIRQDIKKDKLNK